MRIGKYLLGVSMASILLASQAHAQAGAAASAPNDAAPSQDDANEIIVTANKRSQALNDVGLAITAIGGDSLERRKVSSLSDLAQNVPGLSFTPSTNSTPVYTLRGIGFYETSLAAYPTVSVYLDEAPLPFPVMTTLTNFDLDRVEVLKGPQGTLFGNNATGGAINYIAAKPQAAFGVGGTLSYARFNDVRAEAYVTGALSPTLNGRLAVVTQQSDGWQRSMTRPRDNNGATHSVAGRLLLDWEPSSDLRIQLNINGSSDHSQPMAAQYSAFREQFPGSVNRPLLESQVPAPRDPRVADWSDLFRPSARNWLAQGILRADLELGNGVTLTSLTSYTHYDHDQVVDGDGLALSVVDFILNAGNIDSFSQELRVANDPAADFRWLLGANYARDVVFEDNLIDYKDTTAFDTFGGVSVSGYDSRQTMNNYAVFVNLELDVVPTVTIKGGARYTQADRHANICAYDPYVVYDPRSNGSQGQFAAFITATSTALSGSTTPLIGPYQCYQLNAQFKPERTIRDLDEDNLSYRVGIDWKPSRDLIVYANVAKGYKAGSFPTLAGTFDTSFNPVTQESVLSLEGGIKATLADRLLSIDAALFHYDYRNKQLRSKLNDPVIGVLDALVNIPKSSVIGFEAAATLRPSRELSIGGAMTYLDATIDRFTGVNAAGVNQDFDGFRVPYTPKWQYGINADYIAPLSDRLNGFAGVQWNHRSGTNAVIGDPALFALPSYGLLDFQLGVEADDQRWRAFVWGKNVTNEFYLTHVQQSYDAVARYAGRPATYGVTVSFKY